jgi:hypothetical protein
MLRPALVHPDNSCLNVQNVLLSLQNKQHCRTKVQILDCTKLQTAAESKPTCWTLPPVKIVLFTLPSIKRLLPLTHYNSPYDYTPHWGYRHDSPSLKLLPPQPPVQLALFTQFSTLPLFTVFTAGATFLLVIPSLLQNARWSWYVLRMHVLETQW